MIVKCACQHCQQPLEFEAEHAGAFIECPGCQKQTRLLTPGGPGFKKFSDPADHRTGEKKKMVGNVALLLGVILVIVLSGAFGGWIIAKFGLDTILTLFGGGVLGLIGLILAAISFILACFWTVFPWMMWLKMNEQIELLKQIRDAADRPK